MGVVIVLKAYDGGTRQEQALERTDRAYLRRPAGISIWRFARWVVVASREKVFVVLVEVMVLNY